MNQDEAQHWLQQQSRYSLIRGLWEACIAENAAIAVWKLPQSTAICLLADFSSKPVQARLQLHEPISGFAISPFMNGGGEQTLLLHPDLFIRFETTVSLIHNDVPARFWITVKQHLGSSHPLRYHFSPEIPAHSSEDKSTFIRLVRQALNRIHAHEFDKVVLARSLTEPRSDHAKPDDLIRLFDRLTITRPNALVSLISLAGYGTWIGSSPEVLVKTDTSHQFHTHSLAGTQPCLLDKPLAEIRWSQKEIEEQAMVSRFIIEQFKRLRLRQFIETGPMTVKAGQLLHLLTRYQVDMLAIKRPTIATEMLQLLHPTAAVCGLPRQPALHFIQENEPLQRQLYSGYLGPVNIQQETHLFVNLRCMQIQEKQRILYAGCGITHHSDPHREWQETSLKCNSLRDGLNA